MALRSGLTSNIDEPASIRIERVQRERGGILPDALPA